MSICSVCGKEYELEEYCVDFICSRECAVEDLKREFADWREE